MEPTATWLPNLPNYSQETRHQKTRNPGASDEQCPENLLGLGVPDHEFTHSTVIYIEGLKSTQVNNSKPLMALPPPELQEGGVRHQYCISWVSANQLAPGILISAYAHRGRRCSGLHWLWPLSRTCWGSVIAIFPLQQPGDTLCVFACLFTV